MAHITGGGLTDNLPRCLPKNVKARIDIVRSGWNLPPVFKWLKEMSMLPQDELLRTFNCGIGMVLVVKSENVGEIMESLRKSGELDHDPYIIGELVERKSDNESQVEVVGDLS